MAKVIATVLGIPHFYAKCNECEWTHEDYRDRRAGYRAIRAHVESTGHTVQLERGFSTVFRLALAAVAVALYALSCYAVTQAAPASCTSSVGPGGEERRCQVLWLAQVHGGGL